jgi:3-oxoadipyl-CoA thiolase
VLNDVFLCDGVRTPIGRYGGALSSVRTDDLAAIPLRALLHRNASLNPTDIDEVVIGCANQAGEDNRNVARIAALLAGLPVECPAVTVNRLCGSGLDAVAIAARAVATGEADVVIAGGVEGMSRAPFVLGKIDKPFARDAKFEDTTMGWRFVNSAFRAAYGVETMPQTAENLAMLDAITREQQDAFALQSQERAFAARSIGRFSEEIEPVHLPGKHGAIVSQDEHPRQTTLESLAQLKPVVAPNGSITAGNSSGINDGSVALLIANANSVEKHGLRPRARILGASSAGVEPKHMGLGPVPATLKLLARLGLQLRDFGIVELNEAFAAQALAVLNRLNLASKDERINPNGGAIALGHPLGMSGGRLILTAMIELERRSLNKALCTMCVGVGQGVALAIERVT